MSDIKDTAKREVEKTQQSLKDARSQLGAALRSASGPPAEDEDQAVSQIEAIREQLERDLGALRSRVPDPQSFLREHRDQIRTVGLAAAGGVAVLATTVTARGRRRSRKAHEQAVHEQAAAIARELAKIEFHEIVEEERGGGRKLVAVALAAAGAGIGVWLRSRTSSDDVEVWEPEVASPYRPGEVEGRPSSTGVAPGAPAAGVPAGAAAGRAAEPPPGPPSGDAQDEVPVVPGTEPIPPTSPRTPGAPPA